MCAGSVALLLAQKKNARARHGPPGRYFSIHYVALKRAIYAR